MSEGAAGGPAEVQTPGEEARGAGGEERVRGGGEGATRQTPGGKCLRVSVRSTRAPLF